MIQSDKISAILGVLMEDHRKTGSVYQRNQLRVETETVEQLIVMI